MRVCIQLRKSREDVEKEKFGIDTLKAHESTLLELAKKRQYNVVKIKREKKSGGSLYSRPEMLSTLDEIEQGDYDGVMCMDIDRLGRSGMKEQGIILDTFRDNGVLIITPDKIYDLNNDSDMLHTDIKSFIARQELNLIKKRLENGRIRSVKDGQYIYTVAPYGYKKVTVNKLKTLEIIPEQANIVRLIFDMYVNQDKGAIVIARELKSLGAINASGNSNWSICTIKAMIHNPVYYGMVYSKKRTYKLVGNKMVSTVNKNPIIKKGLHEGIISYELFQKAQEVAKNRYNVSAPVNEDKELKNPLAGILKCCCGYAMYIKKDKKAERLNCSNRCGSKGTNIIRVEKRILDDMKEYFKNLTIDFEQLNEDNKFDSDYKKLEIIQININKKKNQLNKLYELLEQGVYTTELFLERSKIINDELDDLQSNLDALKLKVNDICIIQENIKEIPKIQNILDIYETLSIGEKNIFLKSIINKITYYKNTNAAPDDFKLIYDMKISN